MNRKVIFNIITIITIVLTGNVFRQVLGQHDFDLANVSFFGFFVFLPLVSLILQSLGIRKIKNFYLIFSIINFVIGLVFLGQFISFA